jgi:hypothetical protein
MSVVVLLLLHSPLFRHNPYANTCALTSPKPPPLPPTVTAVTMPSMLTAAILPQSATTMRLQA